jgi:hypothetical protein
LAYSFDIVFGFASAAVDIHNSVDETAHHPVVDAASAIHFAVDMPPFVHSPIVALPKIPIVCTILVHQFAAASLLLHEDASISSFYLMQSKLELRLLCH